MEPMKPQKRRAAITAHAATLPAGAPGVDTSEALMREYERLLAERFMSDPDAPPAAPVPGVQDREERLRELHALLFP